MGDVLRTTFVLGAFVAGLFLVAQLFFSSTPEHAVPEVDYRTAAAGAKDSAGFDPWIPAELGEDWRATVAKFDGNRWFLVVNTPDRDFLSLEQARMGLDEALTKSTVDDEDLSNVTIDGNTWQRGTNENGDIALAREDGDVSIVVIGSGSFEDVRAYVASLVPFSSVD